MKIHEWIGNPMSALGGEAIIEIEPGEVADIEKMIALVDSEDIPFFGARIDLENVEGAVGAFPGAKTMRGKKRWYRVYVSKD